MEATIDLYNALLKHFLSLDGFNLVSTSPRQGSEVFSLRGRNFCRVSVSPPLLLTWLVVGETVKKCARKHC